MCHRCYQCIKILGRKSLFSGFLENVLSIWNFVRDQDSVDSAGLIGKVNSSAFMSVLPDISAFRSGKDLLTAFIITSHY